MKRSAKGPAALIAVLMLALTGAVGAGQAAALAAPVNTVAPTISGTATVGQTLTAERRHVEQFARFVRIPVAAVQRRRQQLRQHCERNPEDLSTGRDGRGPCGQGESDRDER